MCNAPQDDILMWGGYGGKETRPQYVFTNWSLAAEFMPNFTLMVSLRQVHSVPVFAACLQLQFIEQNAPALTGQLICNSVGWLPHQASLQVPFHCISPACPILSLSSSTLSAAPSMLLQSTDCRIFACMQAPEYAQIQAKVACVAGSKDEGPPGVSATCYSAHMCPAPLNDGHRHQSVPATSQARHRMFNGADRPNVSCL